MRIDLFVSPTAGVAPKQFFAARQLPRLLANQAPQSVTNRQDGLRELAEVVLPMLDQMAPRAR
jgi:hypothetical protein